MNSDILHISTEYFQNQLGLELEQFASPLGETDPCGPDLRANGLYSEIADARRADDPSLPRGEWAHELKRAEWPRITEITTKALLSKTKDLQLVAWLMEAEIHQRGFNSVGPCLVLMDLLIENFWDKANPPIEDWDLRYNIFSWIDQKIAPLVNQVPLAISTDGSETLSGVHLDRALEIERMVEARQIDPKEVEGPRWKDFAALVARTTDDHYIDFYQGIQVALIALEELDARLEQVFGTSDAPGLSTLQSQLYKSLEFVQSEIDKRGLFEQPVTDAPPEEIDGESPDGERQGAVAGSPDGRHQAYEQLGRIADYLARIEPHSPVPYLIRRAVSWGRFNTAELYNEIFLHNKGQIDVFELLGITAHQEQGNA